MSNTLTSDQIASFDNFAANVKEYMDDHSVQRGENKHFLRMNRAEFGEVFLTASRLSKLAPVMNNVTFFEENGRTKMQFQLRYKDDHPQAGSLIYRPDGKAVMSRRHCVMYSTEAYREMRKNLTGLSTPETVYYVAWDEVPVHVQKALSSKFPKASDTAPKFTPVSLAIVLRKGLKPNKGEKRHQWAGFDFLVVGSYGEEKVVIAQAAVLNKPFVAKLAKVIGAECPQWNAPQEKEEETEPLDRAASSLTEQLCGMLDF